MGRGRMGIVCRIYIYIYIYIHTFECFKRNDNTWNDQIGGVFKHLKRNDNTSNSCQIGWVL